MSNSDLNLVCGFVACMHILIFVVIGQNTIISEIFQLVFTAF